MENKENKPIEKDELTGDKILSGHEYDDIKELDNRLPRWWLWLHLWQMPEPIFSFVLEVPDRWELHRSVV